MNDLTRTLDQIAQDFIGFDDAFRHMRRRGNTPQANTSFPPYNVIQDGERIAIELAIAGYTPEEVDIEYEDGLLTIKGEKTVEEKQENDKYLYRGIAGRKFERSFTLADTVVVDGANYENGILTIEMHNELPEHKKHRKIEVSNSTNAKQFLQE